MALHYNLSKIYVISEDDSDIVSQNLKLFVTDIPQDLKKIKQGIKEKDHKLAYTIADKIQPILDLLGLDSAFEEVGQIKNWAEAKGKKKEIKEIYKSLKVHIKKALKEIKKDFNL